MPGKKGDAAVIILVILIIVILIAWWISISQRECNSDTKCGEGRYCGYDYKCHQVPVVENTIMQYEFTRPALVLGVCIIIAAIIIRWKPEYMKKLKLLFRR